MDRTHLSEGRGVKTVLAGNLQADGVAGGGVPGSLGTSLNLSVDAVVVAGGEEGQVVAGSDGSRVLGNAVTDGSGVLGDGSLVDVVATLSTDEEALVAEDGVEVGSGALQEVEEGTGVQVGLLEVEVELGTLGLLSGLVLGEDLSLEALGDVVVELELGVESIGGGPGLGEGEAYSSLVYEGGIAVLWYCSELRHKDETSREGGIIPMGLSTYLASSCCRYQLALVRDLENQQAM